MKEQIVVSDSKDFECPECGGDLVEDLGTAKTVHCTVCCQVFKAKDLIAVDTVLIMEDEDMVKDDSGIGYELRELLAKM